MNKEHWKKYKWHPEHKSNAIAKKYPNIQLKGARGPGVTERSLEIAQAYENKMKPSDIQTKFGVTRQRVEQIRKKLGIPAHCRRG